MAKKEEADKKGADKSAVGTPTKIESGKPPIGGTGQSNKNFEPRPETSADQTAHNIETVEELESCYPQLVSEIRDETPIEPEDNQGAATAGIETVEELEIVYPKLVSAVRDEVVKQISKCTLAQVKTNMPEFYERLVMEIQNKSGLNLNVPGFLLEVDDPFAEGTLRTYQRLKGIGGLRLPHVLPYKDKKTKESLQSYIRRAAGGGDNARADAARRAMEKIK